MISVKSALENSQYKHHLNNVDGVYIFLNPEWKRIAVSVSGGADSALLAFLLSTLITQRQLEIEIHIISNIRMWKTRPWQRKNSIDVFDWLTKQFPKLVYVRHENFVAPEIEYGSIGPIIPDRNNILKSGDQISVKSHAEYICFRENINAWFAGITKNPDDSSITLKMQDRDNEFEGDIDPLIYKNDFMYICHPFKYNTKKWTMTQYKKHSLEDLLAITRSCEGDNNSYPEIFKGLDYKNYNNNSTVPECGKCFWCQERTWGLKNAE
jgi:hypothetical protein